MGVRVEKDTMGKVKIPSSAYYGIFTVRAKENFPISNLTIHPEMNKAIVQIKKASAQTNMDLKALDKKIGNAIVRACNDILKGKYEGEFILNVYQAGAGTPWHMNVNEVVSNVALKILGKRKGSYKIINPHDHVNMSQSSNDVMPSALRIASLLLIERLELEVNKLIISLKKKSKEFRNLAKVARTHYRDAVPITLGQEFGAWASDLEKRLKVVKGSLKNLRGLSLGGTAVGTGFNVPKGFDRNVIKHLKKNINIDLKVAKNKIEETQFMTDFLDLSSGLRSFSIDLGKICGDLILLSSGPTSGFNEIRLPKVEPGSSIMPGKFNPSIVEMLKMVCDQIIGNDEAIKEACKDGSLDLNVMVPIISYNLLQDLDILRNGINVFDNKCVKGIKANKDVLERYFEGNPILATALNKVIGYDRSAEIVKESLKKNKSVKEIVLEKKILNKKQMEKVFSKESFGL